VSEESRFSLMRRYLLICLDNFLIMYGNVYICTYERGVLCIQEVGKSIEQEKTVLFPSNINFI